MVETRLSARGGTVALAFVLGIGLGWLGASRQAMLENRDRDIAGFDTLRQRLDAEYMRRLDLNEEQRRLFTAVWDEAHGELDLTMGKMRPDIDRLLRGVDARLRPALSPRQLAVYDRIETERRARLPERPVGSD